MPTAYPVEWPKGWPRTASHERQAAPFRQQYPTRSAADPSKMIQSIGRVSLQEARKRLLHQMGLMKAINITVSTNVKPRSDGEFPGSAAEPQDPSLAVYFSISGLPYCLACDRWDRLADNLTAIAKHIDAMRGQARWGVGNTQQAFAGYAQIEAPAGASHRPWWTVLGVSEEYPLPAIEGMYRELVKTQHPDRGGSVEGLQELNRAIEEARSAKAKRQ